MRTFAVTKAGAAPSVVDAIAPNPAAGEVRVRVRAASVNGFDLAVVGGMLQGVMDHRYPVVLGKDFAGTIDGLGEGVDGYALGDRVFGVVTKAHLEDGSFGQYVNVPVTTGIAHLPDGIDFVRGAALGLAGVTAALAVDAAEIHPGHRVLIIGATGGVGTHAVQYAARAGATVVATARTEEGRALIRQLGAHQTIDYSGDLSAAIRELQPDGVHTVLHFAGDPAELLPAVRDGGRIVSSLLLSPDQLSSTGTRVVPVYANPAPDMLLRVAQLALNGVKTIVQATFLLEDTARALQLFSSGARGKIVIIIP